MCRNFNVGDVVSYNIVKMTDGGKVYMIIDHIIDNEKYYLKTISHSSSQFSPWVIQTINYVQKNYTLATPMEKVLYL